MQSYYEITVSLRGSHLFATAPRSLTTSAKADELLNTLKAKFHESAGYKVQMTYWECVGHPC